MSVIPLCFSWFLWIYETNFVVWSSQFQVISYQMTSRLVSNHISNALMSFFCLYYKYYDDNCSDVLFAKLDDIKRSTWLAARSLLFRNESTICNRIFSAKCFFSRISRLCNSVPATCFPENLDLQKM